MRNSHPLFRLLSAQIFCALSFWQMAYASPTTTEKIKIGVPVPLTGTTANWGKDIANAVTFANEIIGGGQYSLVIEDDKCDPREAVSIAHKFAEVDGIKFSIGHACSGPLLATAPIYERAGVIAIYASASAAKISDAGDYIFRTWPSDGVGVMTLSRYIAIRHKRVGILTEQTEYAQGIQDGIMKNAGTFEVFPEEYMPGTTDFRSLLLRLQQKRIDALVLNPQGDGTLIPMLTQLQQLHFNLPKYAIYYGASETVRALGGDLTNGLVFADVSENDSIVTEQGNKLLAQFKERYPIHFSPMVVMTAIEGFRALDAAIKSGSEPKKYLYSSQFDGLFGTWSFDKKGDIQGIPFVMKRIENHAVHTISEEDQAVSGRG